MEKIPAPLLVGFVALVLFQGWTIREVRHLRAGDESRCEGRADHDPQLPVLDPVSHERSEQEIEQPGRAVEALSALVHPNLGRIPEAPLEPVAHPHAGDGTPNR